MESATLETADASTRVALHRGETGDAAETFCPRRVLVLGDDAAFSDRLCAQIDESEEFVSLCASSVAGAIAKLNQLTPIDLLLLDETVPDLDGLSASRRLRNCGVRQPIILVAASDADYDARIGLDGEADDVLLKPVKTASLLARLRAHAGAPDRQIMRLGPYEFRPDSKLLYSETSSSVRLTVKETALLLRLARAQKKSVSRSLLLEQIWGYSRAVVTHTIETHVYRLRQKIRAAGAIDIIETCTGGYRLREI